MGAQLGTLIFVTLRLPERDVAPNERDHHRPEPESLSQTRGTEVCEAIRVARQQSGHECY